MLFISDIYNNHNPQKTQSAVQWSQKYPSKAKTGGLTNTKPKRKGAAQKMNFDTAPSKNRIPQRSIN